MKAVKVNVWVLAGLLAVGGCQKGITKDSDPAHDPLATAQTADLERNTEAQLVEQMGRYREQYRNHLELLGEFYDRQGNQLKAEWAAAELEHLNTGPTRPYLVVAELAGADLRASTAVPEADELFGEAIELLKQGRPKIANLFSDKNKLYLAIDKFNEMITTYPNSDKIDDAAFQIGEINRRYLKDYNVALLYYQRAWQWDPETTLPVRYATALIYDEHMHDRIKAIQYYEQAINLESSYVDNVLDAQRRIKVLNTELGGPPYGQQ